MKGIFIPEITVEMFRDGCLESIETLMTEGEVYDIEYDPKTAEPEPHWIPCSERLPEEDHWLGGSGKQFSDNVLISIVNRDDEDAWIYVSHTIDGEWTLDLSRYCKVLAWMPLPPAYKGE